MKLLVSNFMSRARSLPQERRSFLLDMMEQTRQSYERISENSQYERYPLNYTPWERFALWERKKRELSLTVQTGSVAMWLVLDDPKKRSAQEIELRLREIDRLVMHHGFRDMYKAVESKIEGSVFNEKHIPSGESIPEYKQKEYENRIKEYIRSTDSEREQFIAKIKFPKWQRKKIRVAQTGRQRED